MKAFTEDELHKAYYQWLRSYISMDFDQHMQPYLKLHSQSNSTWLTDVRRALQLSRQSVASGLKISIAAYARYEKNECDGSITLKNLKRAAEAMDCELIYAIRPKSQKSCAQIIWDCLKVKSLQHRWLLVCDQTHRGAALAGIARRLNEDPEFRKTQGWSRRKI